MLPKYLPPEDAKNFDEAKKAAEELSVTDAFNFVHRMIDSFEEKEGLEPLAALEKTHDVLCTMRDRQTYIRERLKGLK